MQRRALLLGRLCDRFPRHLLSAPQGDRRAVLKEVDLNGKQWKRGRECRQCVSACAHTLPALSPPHTSSSRVPLRYPGVLFPTTTLRRPDHPTQCAALTGNATASLFPSSLQQYCGSTYTHVIPPPSLPLSRVFLFGGEGAPRVPVDDDSCLFVLDLKVSTPIASAPVSTQNVLCA
jgi:hypothetical protein